MIDLYTDAGLSRDGLGTWACVAVAGGAVVFEASGPLRDATDDSTTAELRSIANGLHKAIRQGACARGMTVRIICDNAWAIGLIRGNVSTDGRYNRTAKNRHARALGKLRELARIHGITLKADGVKGHQPAASPDPKVKFNRRCDELCRKARAAILAQGASA